MVIQIILGVCLAVSLVFNIYFAYGCGHWKGIFEGYQHANAEMAETSYSPEEIAQAQAILMSVAQQAANAEEIKTETPQARHRIGFATQEK